MLIKICIVIALARFFIPSMTTEVTAFPQLLTYFDGFDINLRTSRESDTAVEHLNVLKEQVPIRLFPYNTVESVDVTNTSLNLLPKPFQQSKLEVKQRQICLILMETVAQVHTFLSLLKLLNVDPEVYNRNVEEFLMEKNADNFGREYVFVVLFATNTEAYETIVSNIGEFSRFETIDDGYDTFLMKEVVEPECNSVEF